MLKTTRIMAVTAVIGLVSAVTLAPAPASASLIGDEILGTMNFVPGIPETFSTRMMELTQ